MSEKLRLKFHVCDEGLLVLLLTMKNAHSTVGAFISFKHSLPRTKTQSS